MRRAPKPKERVQQVELKQRQLLLLEAEQFGQVPTLEQGAIVWFEPAAEATSEEVQAFKRALERAGALRAKALPAPLTSLDAPPGAAQGATPPIERANIRSIVLEVLARVEAEIRPEVAACVEAALAEAGL